MKVTIHDHRPVGPDQQRAGRQVSGHAVAPVRRRRPRPQLRVVDAAAGHAARSPSTWPATWTSASRPRSWPGASTSNKADRIKAYQQVNQYLAQDIPYLWLARDTWAVVANPNVQNFANPTTLAGPRPSPSTRACSGRRRSGVLSHQLTGDRWQSASAHFDVVEVLLAPVGVALLGQPEAERRVQRLHEGRSWLTATMVPGQLPSIRPTAVMDDGSRLLVGSSSSNRLASPAESMARPNLARSPPDSVAGSWSAAFDGRPNEPEQGPAVPLLLEHRVAHVVQGAKGRDRSARAPGRSSPRPRWPPARPPRWWAPGRRPGSAGAMTCRRRCAR